MKRLTDSILAHIFYLSISIPVFIPTPSDATTPRQKLMAVCHRWRRVIESSPLLWSNAQFLPDSSVHHLRLLSYSHQWIHRTAGSPVTVKFDGDYASANRGSSPTETKQLMYGAGHFCFIQHIVLPCAHRITSLTCTVATNKTIRAFFRIPAGSLSALEHMDILFINQYSDWISGFTSQELAMFTAFRGMGSLRILILHLLNGIHPLYLQIPWNQLSILDLGTRATPPDVFRTILRHSTSLVEGCFLIKFTARGQVTILSSRVILESLRVLRLLLINPNNEPEMLKRLIFPNLVDLRLEHEDLQQGWKLITYLSILRKAPQLHFLTLAHYKSRIPLIDTRSHRMLNHRNIPVPEMKRFLNAIPNIVCLRLPLSININAYLVEDMALGYYTPLLETLELGSIHGDHILDMVHRRNLLVENPQSASPFLGETSAMGAAARDPLECGLPVRTISQVNLSIEEDEQVLASVQRAVRAHHQNGSRVDVQITPHDPRLFYHPQ